jgi:transposase
MLPYGLELRRRIVDAYQNREGSIRELAARFNVSRSTVQRYLDQWRKARSLASKPPGCGHPRTLDARAEQLLAELLREQNGQPDREYARRLAERSGRPVAHRASSGRVAAVEPRGQTNVRSGGGLGHGATHESLEAT